ncbi:MlaD family protein [Paraconexibacter antarcticus]|uniref:MlaD family protein n=1 Tax=Paraconexibacter antarcticus TaxID=2949664 RepID=A0ABY5DXH9_9ACTN|nr:MlaD family protein [Paraconexibacter antarcticus]UTI66741.1 MlaD family protein [Paraconexibacter antarcticus]
MTRTRVESRGTERRYLRAAALATVLVVALTYVAFGGRGPFARDFELRGVFRSSNQLKPGDPVRVAGVDIGRVRRLSAGPDHTTLVTMRIVRADGLLANAALSVRPRLLFEGSFYVDVQPGAPPAGPLRSGMTIPVNRTRGPVQVDQVLSVLDTPARDAITRSMRAMATGLGGPRARSGYRGLRRATRELDRSLTSIRRVAGAVQGTQPGDLHRAVAAGGNVTAQLASDPAALGGLVTNVDRVAAALGGDDGALAASVRRLDEVLRVAPVNLRLLDGALPALGSYAGELRPTLRRLPATLASGTRLLRAVQAVTDPSELPALVRALPLVNASLPGVERGLATAFALAAPAARCISRNVLPVLKTEVPDSGLSTGRPAWQDLLHMTANLTQTSPGFDGNGGTLRIGLSESENTLVGDLPGIGEVIGYGNLQGLRPVWLGAGKVPEYRPDQPCERQPLPDLKARSRPGLPPGLRSVPAPKVGAEQLRRQQSMLRALTGSDAQRRDLLRKLLVTPKPGRRP